MPTTRISHLESLFAALDQGYCLCEMIRDESGRPVDYRFLETNPVFAEMTGLSNAQGRTARELVPGLEQHWIDAYDAIARGVPARFQNGSEAMGRWFDVFGSPVPPEGCFALVFRDISSQRRAELEREEARAQAERLQGASNAGFTEEALSAAAGGLDASALAIARREAVFQAALELLDLAEVYYSSSRAGLRALPFRAALATAELSTGRRVFESAAAGGAQAAGPGGLRILVVDDEPNLVELVGEVVVGQRENGCGEQRGGGAATPAPTAGARGGIASQYMP